MPKTIVLAAAENAPKHQMVRMKKTLANGKPFLRRREALPVLGGDLPDKEFALSHGFFAFSAFLRFIKVSKKSDKTFFGLPRTFVKMAKLHKMKEKIY